MAYENYFQDVFAPPSSLGRTMTTAPSWELFSRQLPGFPGMRYDARGRRLNLFGRPVGPPAISNIQGSPMIPMTPAPAPVPPPKTTMTTVDPRRTVTPPPVPSNRTIYPPGFVEASRRINPMNDPLIAQRLRSAYEQGLPYDTVSPLIDLRPVNRTPVPGPVRVTRKI